MFPSLKEFVEDNESFVTGYLPVIILLVLIQTLYFILKVCVDVSVSGSFFLLCVCVYVCTIYACLSVCVCHLYRLLISGTGSSFLTPRFVELWSEEKESYRHY